MFSTYEEITEKAFSLILSELESLGFDPFNLWSTAYSADTFTTFCGIRADLLPSICTALNGNYSNIARVIITDDCNYTADIGIAIMQELKTDNYFLHLVANPDSEKDERTETILKKVNRAIRNMYF